jgi:hypothetical protein
VDTNHALVAGFTPVGVKVPQTIQFANIPPRTLSQPKVRLKATATSGLPIHYTVLSGPATVAGDRLTLTGTGTVFVRAKQPGNDGFASAPGVTKSFVVSN